MRRSRELKQSVTCVMVLVLLYQFAPAALFSPIGKMLLAYVAIQRMFLILGDARQEPHDDPPWHGSMILLTAVDKHDQ